MPFVVEEPRKAHEIAQGKQALRRGFVKGRREALSSRITARGALFDCRHVAYILVR
jgi:4'-phosphopantetheinyl transferase EntD